MSTPDSAMEETGETMDDMETPMTETNPIDGSTIDNNGENSGVIEDAGNAVGDVIDGVGNAVEDVGEGVKDVTR